MTWQRVARTALSTVLAAGFVACTEASARADAPGSMTASESSLVFPLLTSPNIGLEAKLTLNIDAGYQFEFSDSDYVLVGDDPVPHQVTQIDDQDCRDHRTGPTCTVYIRTWSQLWQDAHEPRGDTEIFDECTGAGVDSNCVEARIPLTFGPDAADRFVPALPSTPAELDFIDIPAGTTATHDVAVRPDSGFAFAHPSIDGQSIPAPDSAFGWRDGTCVPGSLGDCTAQITYSPTTSMPSTAYEFAAVEVRGPVSIYPANLGWIGHANAVGQAPQITSANNATFHVGTWSTATITATGVPSARITEESGTLPPGLTFTAGSDGTATIAGTPALGSVGNYPITLTATNGVTPDATQSFTLNVIKASSTTTLAVSPSPPRFGRPATLTATVTSPASGSSGTVDFYDNGDVIGTTNLAAGTATLTVSTLPAGDNVLTASYRGDANHGESASPPVNGLVTYTRCIAGTATSVSVASGEAVCVTGTVSGSINVRPGGSLAILDARVLGTVRTSGASAVTICGSSIGPDVSVIGSTGPVLIGSVGDTRASCAGNRIGGALTVRNNTGGVEIGSNAVVGVTTVNQNVTGAPPGTEIAGNLFDGMLTCRGNVPAPNDSGLPNVVHGLRFGQCAAVTF